MKILELRTLTWPNGVGCTMSPSVETQPEFSRVLIDSSTSSDKKEFNSSFPVPSKW